MRRFIVITCNGHTERAFGVYRSFKAASADAKAWNGIVLELENKDTAPNPWDVYYQSK